jgi:hypothetical protein
MTFVSLGVIVYPAIIAVNLSWQFADSYWPSMLMLSESKLYGINGINPHQ